MLEDVVPAGYEMRGTLNEGRESKSLMYCPLFQQRKTQVFGVLNQIVAPLVRAGYGSPGFLPFGLIMLETTGRKTGRRYHVPVMAKRWGDMLVVGTVRHGSQWIKNLRANPQLQVWIQGRPQASTAYVVDAASSSVSCPLNLTPHSQLLLQGLGLLSALHGVQFAILIPQEVMERAALPLDI